MDFKKRSDDPPCKKLAIGNPCVPEGWHFTTKENNNVLSANDNMNALMIKGLDI